MNNHVGLHWEKSVRSESGNCVEIASDDSHVYMRDSKDPDGAILTFDRQAFAAFIADLKQLSD